MVDISGQLKEGDFAPDFTLDKTGGEKITLSDLKDTALVLYFYPKDDTPGCTNEAKDFAALYEEFIDAGVEIYGISKDSIARHEKFKDKHELPFDLLSDENSSVCEAYSVWVEKKMYGKEYMGIERTTFLIDKEGQIKRIWNKVKVSGHAAQVLETAREL